MKESNQRFCRFLPRKLAYWANKQTKKSGHLTDFPYLFSSECSASIVDIVIKIVDHLPSTFGIFISCWPLRSFSVYSLRFVVYHSRRALLRRNICSLGKTVISVRKEFFFHIVPSCVYDSVLYFHICCYLFFLFIYLGPHSQE